MIVTVASQKGGVGKTACALNVSACLGERTLLVDLDPQGACAISLGINADQLSQTVYDALMERVALADVITPTPFGFDLAPSNIDLAEAEILLQAVPGREYALTRALEPVLTDYDTIVIDTPPTLGLLTMNAFAAADSVLIPVSTQLLSLRGLTTLLETIEKVKRYKINPDLAVAGILPTKYDARTIHGRQVADYLIQYGRDRHVPVFEPIRATVRFDEATNDQTPFVVLYPNDESSAIYRKVADDITQKD